MNRNLASALFALCLFTTIPRVARAQTSEAAENKSPDSSRRRPPPTVDSILEKALQASGGRKAWSRIVSIHFRGTVESASPGGAPGFEIYAKAPNRLLQTITLADGTAMREGFDGKRAWRSDPGQGVQEIKGDALDDLKRQAEFHSDLHLRDQYPDMQFVGESQIEGDRVYIVGADGPEAQQVKIYFDMTTGLRVGMSTTEKHAQTPSQSSFYGDFHDLSGVKVPYTIRMVSTQGTMTLRLEQAAANETIPDSTFAKPAPSK